MTSCYTGAVRWPAARPRAWNARIVVPIAVFVGLTFVRTRGISQTFQLLGDQILYWRIALGPWRELPLGGGPSSVGGTTLGPVFCWVLWAIRHVVGPWTDNLPHAGGIGLSIIQSAADACLLVAVWRKTASLALALAVTLFVATAPFDMSLTATIWNPPLAVAFAKIAIAMVLLGGENPSIGWCVAGTAAAVLSVHAHSAAVFLAVPVIASYTIREVLSRRWRAALQRARATAEVIVLLQIPYLLDLILRRPERVGPTMVIANVLYTVDHPEMLRIRDAFHALISACEYILLTPATFAWFGAVVLVSVAIVAFRWRRDVMLLGATAIPILAAIAGFSFWLRGYDHYWFLPIAPSVALTIALAMTAWRPAASAAGVVLLAVVIAALPARIAAARTMNRLPEYGALVKASRAIRRHTPEIRAIVAEFPLPPTADPEFVYEVLGGRVTPDAGFRAIVSRSGDVTYKPDAP
jgi:hypothetical protein